MNKKKLPQKIPFWMTILPLMLLTACASQQSAQKNRLIDELGSFTTLLLANDLPVCSTKHPEYCQAGQGFSEVTYTLSHATINKIAAWPHWSALRLDTKERLLERLRNALGSEREKTLSDKKFKDLLAFSADQQINLSFYEQLYNAEQQMLRFYLAPQAAIKQEVALRYSQSTQAVSVYQEFVRLAAAMSRQPQEKPLIAVISAASTHPLVDGDYYTQLLQQSGARVLWLPIESVLVDSTNDNACDNLSNDFANYYGLQENYHKDFSEMWEKQDFYCRHESVLHSVLHSVNAIFFTGTQGHQLLETFYQQDASGNKFLQVIKKRLDSASLAIGGQSDMVLALLDGSRESRVRAVKPQLSGLSAYQMRSARSLKFLNCPNQKECNQRLGKKKPSVSDNNLSDVFVFGRYFAKKVRFVPLLRSMVESGNQVAVGMNENAALLLSHPKAGRIAIKNLSNAELVILDRSEADTDNETRIIEVEDLLIHNLNQNDLFTYSRVKKRTFVSLTGVAALPDQERWFKVESSSAIGKQYRFFSMLKQFAMAKDDELEYAGRLLEFELVKGSDFNYRLQPLDGTDKFSHLLMNILISKRENESLN